MSADASGILVVGVVVALLVAMRSKDKKVNSSKEAKKGDAVDKANHPVGKVFLVHGHNDGAKYTVAHFLTQLNLNPVILHDQPNNGRTIIEKFEKHARVPLAIVLMTADDLGSSTENPDARESRARQNVVFELGFFVGRLGRGGVVALKEESVTVPSDISGVLYIDFDAAGAWRLKLAKEIRNSGLAVDLNRVI